MSLADSDWEFVENAQWRRRLCLGVLALGVGGVAIWHETIALIIVVMALAYLIRLIYFRKRLVYSAAKRSLTLYVGSEADHILTKFHQLLSIRCTTIGGAVSKVELVFDREAITLPLGIEKEVDRVYVIVNALVRRIVKLEFIPDSDYSSP